MRKTIRHENEWPFGTDVVYMFNDGKGAIGISKEPGLEFGFIHDLIVHPSVRQQGRATYLLKLAEQEIKNNFGRDAAVLRVVPGSWMEEWYKRNGYEDYRGGCIRDGYNDLFKKL